MFEKDFKLYELLRDNQANYRTPYYVICFGCIDAFVENATKEEYEVISDICYNLYLKLDEVCLEKIADCLAEKYASKVFTLEELKTMDKWQIYQYVD